MLKARLEELRRTTGIVIVHYRREAELSHLLETLQGAGWDGSRQIAVVNNGGDRQLVGEPAMRDSVLWIDLPNPGYGAAVNVGVRALAAFDQIVVATHEVTFEEGAFEALAGTLVANPSVGLCGPLLIDGRDGKVWSAGGGLSRIRHMPFHHGAGGRLRPGPGLLDVTWLDGACFALRRQDFLRLHGVEERYFLYFEDIDLGLRAKASLGMRVVCATSAVAFQSPGGHLDVRLATRNLIWVFRSHRLFLALWLFVFESLGRIALGTLLTGRHDNSHQIARSRGLREGLRGIFTF